MNRISIKQMLRSIMFMMLVMMLIIEQPIQALAITDYGSGTGASSGGRPSGSWLDMNFAFQGYRMYIIDINGELASDECYDFLFNWDNTFDFSLTSGNTRYGSFSRDKVMAYPISGLWEKCGSFGTTPPYPVTREKINGVRHGQGEAFKNWMMTNKSGGIDIQWYAQGYQLYADANSHVGNLLANKDVFHVRDTRNIASWKPDVVENNYLKSAYDAIKTGNFFLVVEPLVGTYMGDAPNSYQRKRRFDTYYNFAMEWGGTETFGWYYTPLGKLFPQCLTTTINEDIIYTITSATTGAQKSVVIAKRPQIQTEYRVSQVRQILQSKSGLAMQLYGGTDTLKPNSTSTYDEPLNDTPGPAPDDSSTLTTVDKTDIKKHANIVKFYVNYEDGEVVYKDSFTRTPTPMNIQIEDEKTYKVKDWYVSDTYKEANGESPTYEDYKSSMSNTQTGNKTGTVTINPSPNNETTLYVLLVKDKKTPDKSSGNGDWILEESQLTKHESTTNTDIGNDAFTPVKVTYGSISRTGRHCLGDDDDHGHYHCTNEVEDGDITVKLKIVNRDPFITSVIESTTWGDKWIANSIEDSRSGTGGQSSDVSGFKYDFISQRSQQDPTVIYNGLIGPLGDTKNSVEQNLINMGFTQGTSKSASRISNGTTYRGLTLNFTKDSSDYHTDSACDYDGSHTKSDEASVADKAITGNVEVNTYAGLKSTGKQKEFGDKKQISLSWYGSEKFDKTLGITTNSKSFNFTPYVKMRYDSIDNSNATTYVNGKYTRKLQTWDYAEIAWENKYNGNLNITSNQWSTHKTAYETVGEWNKVLPGGAIFSLDTKDNEQTVAVRTYQVILKGNGLVQAEYTESISDTFKEQTAIDNHKTTVDSVLKGFNTLHVQQWVDKDMNEEDAFSGIAVSAGSNISKLNNGSSKASTDSKYYFLNDTEGTSAGSSEGDLDAEEISKDTVYYTFYSDEKGDIYMMKDFKSPVKILGQKDKIDKLSNSEAKSIDSRTSIVTNFVASIERGTGNDNNASWVTNGAWYNEVFNGVTVIVQTSKIKVGFHNPSDRNTVMDPKLIPKRDSKAGAYKSMNIFQFKMQDKPLAYDNQNQIGTFYGKPLYMKDMDRLFVSDKFYIADTTVQDLSR